MTAKPPIAQRRYMCPVCRREARRTTKGNIWSHYDSLRIDVCPGSGHPFTITTVADVEFAMVLS